MVKDVPRLKRLFLLGCEHLRAIIWNWWSGFKGLLCIDTRPPRMLGCTRPFIAQLEGFELQVHATITDARLARSLSREIVKYYPFVRKVYFNINITSSPACSSEAVKLEVTSKERIESSDEQHHGVPAGLYGDVLSKVGDSPIPMQDFPQPPTQQSDRRIEIGDGSQNVQSEVETYDDKNLSGLLARRTESLHVHDALARTIMPAMLLRNLRWCRAERCPNLEAVFPSGAVENNALKTFWASDLLKARCIWSKFDSDAEYLLRQWRPYSLERLQHLHLRSSPSLQYIRASGAVCLLPQLGDPAHHPLRRPQARIRAREMGAPEQRRVPEAGHHPPARPAGAAADMRGRRDAGAEARDHQDQGMLEPAPAAGLEGPRARHVEAGRGGGVEKEVWDALEWDGVDAGHHPSLYATPVHARCYKKRGLLRGTVLR
ncbi:hypothetical protein PVAP13_6KG014800 [Panicum virgatum]|uniref:Uncharacterized protein n=1 Tax=Panicum virgatum TaxID=38727 RepID=A0A8T0R604_PANVG|nr:hypothetical protein PVAP13_6KG014800 [Panicum virgatum]